MSPVATGWDPAKDRLLSGLTITADGVKVGPCLVTGKIGQGGMGAVYRAWHTMLNLDVAVKILPFHLVDDNQAYVQRFQREAQAAAVVSHQNLVRVFEMGCEKEIYFLILEFVNGESAHGRLARKKTLDEGEALRIVHDATLGLGAAHAKNIIHRDVKPDNILVGHDGTIKLADLGLAKIADADFAMTLSNVAMGTPQFMPPEQIINSKAVTFASDIWAMGITLYYLLTGKYPFNAENLMGLLNIINEATPNIFNARTGVSPATKAVIDRCLQKDPLLRYKNCAEMIAGLDFALRDLTNPVDLTVPSESCLAAQLAPYTPSLPVGASTGGGSGPGSDAPTLIGQGPISNRASNGASLPAPEGSSYTSTLRLPPKGANTPPLHTGVSAAGDAAHSPISTNAVTAVGEPAQATLVTGATTIYDPGGRRRLWPVLLAIAIILPVTGYAVYWGLKVKPYDDAVAAAREFEAKSDFTNAAAAWKSAQAITPTGEATEHATNTSKLASIYDQIHQADTTGDWTALNERCAAFLLLQPDFAPVKTLQAKAVREARQAVVVNGIETDMAKLRKGSDYEWRENSWSVRKKLDAGLLEFPDNRVLKKDYTEIALKFNDLKELERALQYLKECLATPGLPAAEKTELEALQTRATESRDYSFSYEKVVDPLNAAQEAAGKRLEQMVANLEDPTAAKAEAFKLITQVEPSLPTNAKDYAQHLEEAHTKFEKNFVSQAQALSRAAQRKKQYRIAYDALALVIDKIDEYYQKSSVHALAFLKFMLQIQALQAHPLGQIKGFTQDGNGTVVAPENLPVPDVRQIRILQVIDKDTVLAIADGHYLTTTLAFKTWKPITDFTFDGTTLGVSPDLRLSATTYVYQAAEGKTAPKDALTLLVFEQAGETHSYIHALITATQPDFHFNSAGTSLLMIAHAPDKTADQLYELDTSAEWNLWDFYTRQFRSLRTAAEGERFREPIWLPDGSAILLTVYSDSAKTMKVMRLEVKTAKSTPLVTLPAAVDAASGPTGEGLVAVDPSGQAMAVFDASRKQILLVSTTDGKEIAKLPAADVDPAQTGGGITWSADGSLLVYKALDGTAPVFKVVGVNREAAAAAPPVPVPAPVPAPAPTPAPRKGTGLIP